MPDNIWTEWYENGELKRFDYVDRVPQGVEFTWKPDGKVLSRFGYRQGRRIGQGTD